MSNSLLTPTMVTRKALAILHQKLNFIGNVNRQYDSNFAKSGAKIGDTLSIKLPNEYTVREGKTLQAQDTNETSTSLTVATQRGVDMNFSTAELTMDLDNFSHQILEPAVSVLAAKIESDFLASAYKDVYQEVSDVGASVSLANVLNMGKRLKDSLTPSGMTCLTLGTQSNVDLVTGTSNLFNNQKDIGKQYREGSIGNNFLGFGKVYENTYMPVHTTGTDDGTGDHKVNGADQTGSTITHNSAGSGTFNTGDIIAFDGCYDVHPETKAVRGSLKKFVVTADMSGTDTTVSVSPAIVTSGARQNCSASPTNGGAIWKRESNDSTAIGAGADYNIDLGFHRDAFAFASADLEMPNDVHFKSRQVFDGISMRIIRQYDINNDNLPCRLDVLYGHKTIRPELAVRGGFN